jgi:hypothetical protein
MTTCANTAPYGAARLRLGIAIPPSILVRADEVIE